MCTQKYSPQLYAKYGETIRSYLTDKVLRPLHEKSSQGGVYLLQELQIRWNNHNIMTKWYSKLFASLDRQYIKNNDLPSLSQVGLTCFKEIIYEDIKGPAKDAILKMIDQDRDDGEMIDKTLIKNTVKLYEQMEVDGINAYVDDLETHLLQSTRDYYDKKSSEWIATGSTPEYLEKVLLTEYNRVNEYLSSKTESKLLQVAGEEILEKVQDELLRKKGSDNRGNTFSVVSNMTEESFNPLYHTINANIDDDQNTVRVTEHTFGILI